MAFTPTFYPNFKLKQLNGARVIDLDSDAIKVAILKSTYSFSASHDVFSDVSSHEVSGSGYTAGGATIAGVTLILSGNNPVWSFNDITWSQNASGFTDGRTFVAYRVSDGGLIFYGSEASNFGNVSGDLTLDVTASGVATVTG